MEIKCKDVTIYYEEYGTGEPLVLLHGNSENHTYFKHQIEYFQKSYHIYALDTRGHGKSDHGRRHLDFEVFAGDLKIFMDKLNLEKVNLLGFSDGGNIAITFALRYPKYIKKLILDGANLVPRGMRPGAYGLTIGGYHVTKFFSKYSEKMKKRMDVWGLMVHHPHISLEELKMIRFPVLVVAGQYDVIRREHTVEIAKNIPNARMVLIKNGTHFCALKKPEPFNAEVEKFLKEE